MKKNLIALAVFGAFSGAALAQSNVTLYGIIDVGFAYVDPSSGSMPVHQGHPTAAFSPATAGGFAVRRRCHPL